MFKRYKEWKEDRRLEREFDKAIQRAIENGYWDDKKFINIRDINSEERKK